jgi:hypothetical protein
MKVKDLPKNCLLSTVKVRIPDNLSDLKEVYICSHWCAGVWVKSDLQSTRVYPIGVPPQQVLDWEVV